MFPRLLTLFQFTRMALVFTAISNGWAAMLLQSRATGESLSIAYAVAMTIVSVGLYTFGMSLNDLIDRRRDTQIAPGRPLPSGRISVRMAHVVCAMLGMTSLAAGVWMVMLHPGEQLSIVLLAITLSLIVFYDFAGKYLVALGLIVLGLVRFFHAAIPAPTLAIPWHAIVLLTHVTLLSTVCYHLEGKRPRLTLKHWLVVIGGLAAVVVGVLTHLIYQRTGAPVRDVLWITPGLIPAGVAAIVFVLLAVTIRVRAVDARAAGRSMMLYGLVWLIVYDAGFVLGYVGWRYALILLVLLPLSLVAVQVMRAWSQLVELSTKPQYQRAR